MLLLKIFTRQGKKAFRELLRVTEGFKKLPSGYENLSAKDIVRFRKMAAAAGGDYKKIDRDTAKSLLTKMGLNDTAKELDHFLDRQSNKKLVNRYIYGDGQDYEKLINNYMNTQEALRNKKNSQIRKIAPWLEKRAKGDSQLLAEYNKKLKDAEDKSFRNIKKGHYPQLKPIGNQIGSFDMRAIEREEKLKGLPTIIKNKGQLGREQASERISDDFRKNKNSLEDLSLLKKLRQDAYKRRKVGFKNAAADWDMDFSTAVNTKTKKVYVGKKASIPELTAHEIGHIDDGAFNSLVGGSWGKTADLNTLGEEAVASARGLSRMKKLGASEQQLRRGKKHLENGFNTYFGDYISGLSL